MSYGGGGAAGFGSMVGAGIEIAPSKQTGPLSYEDERQIKEETLERLADQNPILKHVMNVKIVQNPRKNLINIRVKPEYLPLIFSKSVASQTPGASPHDIVTYCFFLSDKLEPYVIVTAVHHIQGKLHQLTALQLQELTEAIAEYKAKFQIANESYHYTGLGERNSTDAFTASSGTSRANKAHSSHFHLKMRVATAMVTHFLPIFELVKMGELKSTVEPVKYNYSRDTVSWEECLANMQRDTLPG